MAFERDRRRGVCWSFQVFLCHIVKRGVRGETNPHSNQYRLPQVSGGHSQRRFLKKAILETLSQT